MKKRKYINEILEIKKRNESYNTVNLLAKVKEIKIILDSFSKDENDLSPELLKYIPISTVACFQSYFRETIIDLIDMGEPYSENMVRFNQVQNVKLDFGILNEINTKKFTSGEFVSHLIPCNNLNDFNKGLSILLQSDFLVELRKFNFDFESPNLFKNEFSEIIKSVNKCFELRHILCHEFAFNINLTLKETKIIYGNCEKFLLHTYLFISHLKYPNREDLSDEEILKKVEIEYSKVCEELEVLIETIIQREINSDLSKFFNEELFRKSIELWRDYTSTKIEAKFGILKLTKLKFVYLSFIKSETKKKIEELKESYKSSLIENPLNKNPNHQEVLKDIIYKMLTE